MKIRPMSQLVLEEFGSTLEGAEEGSTPQPLSAEEVRKRSAAARSILNQKFDSPEAGDWSGIYHKLIAAGWPWRIAAFVAWSAVPKSGRWPKTQEELAVTVLGLTSDRSIATWRRKHPTIDQMIADLQAEALLDANADVNQALKESASDPDYKHAPDRRLFKELTGELVSQKVAALMLRNESADGVSRKNLKKLGYDELLALAGDLMGLEEEDSEEIASPEELARNDTEAEE